ncbi:MAG TPA: DUF58 domain-containing protein [Pseudomonadota bacterium]|nr:DUF58 domain-containing protein [Pseudomonadota bacterium]
MDTQASSQKATQAGFDQEFLKKLEYLHIVAKKVFAGRSRADRRTRRAGAGIEFADHRDYAAGDDLRYLDWAVYGRMNRLLLRQFEQEEDLHIYLLIDTSTSMRLGATAGQPLLTPGPDGRVAKLGYAAQVAAALSYVGLSNLDRVALYSFADGLREQLPSARGKGRIFKVFEFLAELVPAGQTDLLASLREFVQRIKRRGVAIVISDFYDHAGYEEGLNLLRYHRFEPAAIQIIDPREARPTLRGDIEIVDMETGELRPVTLSAALCAAYEREHAAYCQALAGFCTSRGVGYIRADTDQPFDELVLRALRQGGFVR